jgi:hypothetical protein
MTNDEQIAQAAAQEFFNADALPSWTVFDDSGASQERLAGIIATAIAKARISGVTPKIAKIDALKSPPARFD